MINTIKVIVKYVYTHVFCLDLLVSVVDSVRMMGGSSEGGVRQSCMLAWQRWVESHRKSGYLIL